MGSTSRFGLHYPDLTDAPNGPAQLQQLAADAETWLCRAFPCTSSTKPSGVAEGFTIDVTDAGTLEVWRSGAWAVVGAGSSGGGGGSGAVGTVSATYAGASAQAISTASDVVVAFPTAQTTDTAVSRATSGAGHSFTLGQTRLWTVSATVRFAAATGGGRTFELRAGSAVLAKAGVPLVDGPYTANLSVTRRLPAGSVITVIARHDQGSGIALEPSSGNYVHIDLGGV